MLIDPDEARAAALVMTRPVVAFDPLQGSQLGQFFLMEYSQRGPRPTDLPPHAVKEMTRHCFNQMRDRGMLRLSLDERLKMHEQCQAWPVIKV